MKSLLLGVGMGIFGFLLPSPTIAGQVASQFGADYNQSTFIPFDPAAGPADGSGNPGDFSNPASGTNGVPYTIYIASDANNAYVLLQTKDVGSGLPFANVYVDSLYNNGMSPGGANLLFEVTNSLLYNLNDPLFAPRSLAGTGYEYKLNVGTATTPDTIEAKIPFSVFANEALTGEGFNGSVQFRASQSFGYTFVGGSSFGPARFGVVSQAVATPEPSTLVGAGMAGVCLLGWTWKRRRSA